MADPYAKICRHPIVAGGDLDRPSEDHLAKRKPVDSVRARRISLPSRDVAVPDQD
jgi:hypothetical protein